MHHVDKVTFGDGGSPEEYVMESTSPHESPDGASVAQSPNRVGRPPQHLLEDHRGMYSNPFTIDWTLSPITAMKLTIEYTEQTVREMPALIDGVVQQGLTKAAELNKQSSVRLLNAFKYAFYSPKQLQNGHKGIFVELDARTTAIAGHLDKYTRGLSTQAKANADLEALVATVSARTTALETLLSTREVTVTTRENKVRQRELNVKTKETDFSARGFWGHFGDALLSLSKSWLGAGFGIIVAVALLLFAGMGVLSVLRVTGTPSAVVER